MRFIVLNAGMASERVINVAHIREVSMLDRVLFVWFDNAEYINPCESYAEVRNLIFGATDDPRYQPASAGGSADGLESVSL